MSNANDHSTLVPVHDVCDLVIAELSALQVELNILKLQKLIYYVQAWHLAFFDKRFFDEEFEAWVHGPVCKEVYKRFVETKGLYSSVSKSDIEGEAYKRISEGAHFHIKSVLEVYGKYSGTQLEEFTHRESPWIEARSGLGPFDHSTTVISDESMASFYKQRLNAG